MIRNIKTGWVLVVSILLLSCSGVKQSTREPAKETDTIYVAKHGWHTSILVKRTSLDTLFSALADRYSGSYYLDISWGDKKYFMAPGNNVWLAVRAALVPTNSVVRVIGLPEQQKQFFSQEIYQPIGMTKHEFKNLVDYMKGAFTHDEMGGLIKVEEKRGFFHSNRKYWGLRTCNTWIAKALRVSGVPVSPVSVTSGSVMRQVKE